MEQALVKAGTLNLVKPECPTAKVLNRISEMVKKEQSENQKNYICYKSAVLAEGFCAMVSCYFGFTFDKRQALDLSDEELNTLFFAVEEKVKKAIFRKRLMLACIPVVGWLILLFPKESCFCASDNFRSSKVSSVGSAKYFIDLLEEVRGATGSDFVRAVRDGLKKNYWD